MKEKVKSKKVSGQFQLLCFLSICCLTFWVSYYDNIFKIANENQFESFSKDLESLVIARIVESRTNGITSHAGFPGASTPNTWDEVTHTDPLIKFQYDSFIYNQPFKVYHTYTSQTGGQGIIFSVLDKILPLNNINKGRFFYGLWALLMAACVTAILYWAKYEFGKVTTLFLAFTLFISNWLTFFAKNLWWVSWSFFLPMTSLLIYFQKKKNFNFKHTFYLSFILVFLKCFMNGFEYITCFVGMTLCPFLYYAIVTKKVIKEKIYIIICGFSSILAGVLAGLLLLLIQLSVYQNDVMYGFNYIIDAVRRRTHAIGDIGDIQQYQVSLNASIMEVLIPYIKSTINPKVMPITFFSVIVIFIFTACFAIYKNKKNILSQQTFALGVTTCTAFLSSTSWFIIFKGHSQVHPHLNNWCWYMPFMIFFPIFLCQVIKDSNLHSFSNKAE